MKEKKGEREKEKEKEKENIKEKKGKPKCGILPLYSYIFTVKSKKINFKNIVRRFVLVTTLSSYTRFRLNDIDLCPA